MHRKLVLIFTLFVLVTGGFSHPPAQARAVQKSCLPAFTSANYFIFLQKNKRYLLPLESSNSGGSVSTSVEFQLELSNQNLSLSAEYIADPNQVGLPYNLDTVFILKNGQLIRAFDFTQSCYSVGASLFPGDKLKIGSIKNISPGEINVIVWGRL